MHQNEKAAPFTWCGLGDSTNRVEIDAIESVLIRVVAFFADWKKAMWERSHTILLYTTDAPKGIKDSLAILKHCFPIGMPRIVMHQRQPRMQYPIAISSQRK